MTIDQLQTWGASHYYPQLVLGRDVLRAGERSWQRFLRQAGSGQIEQAGARVERWMAYEQRDEVVTQA